MEERAELHDCVEIEDVDVEDVGERKGGLGNSKMVFDFFGVDVGILIGGIGMGGGV